MSKAKSNLVTILAPQGEWVHELRLSSLVFALLSLISCPPKTWRECKRPCGSNQTSRSDCEWLRMRIGRGVIGRMCYDEMCFNFVNLQMEHVEFLWIGISRELYSTRQHQSAMCLTRWKSTTTSIFTKWYNEINTEYSLCSYRIYLLALWTNLVFFFRLYASFFSLCRSTFNDVMTKLICSLCDQIDLSYSIVVIISMKISLCNVLWMNSITLLNMQTPPRK